MDADKLPWRLVRRDDGSVRLIWKDSGLGNEQDLGPFDEVAEYLAEFLAGVDGSEILTDARAAEDYGERT